MSFAVELGLSWLSLTSRDSSVTVSPLWIVSAGSLPTSHLKWMRSAESWCVVGIGASVLLGVVVGVVDHADADLADPVPVLVVAASPEIGARDLVEDETRGV